MIDVNDIPGIVSPYVEAYRKAGSGSVGYTERYDSSVEQAFHIGVHANGWFPAHLIKGRAPSETEAEFQYRKEAYQPTTMSPWSKLVNAFESIWHGVTVTVDDESAQEYIGDEYPTYSGVLEWFREVATPKKTDDPNAVVYVTLKDTPESTADLVSPVLKLLGSVDVVDFKDTYFLGVTSRTVPVKYGNGTKNEGLEFVVLDDEFEYRYTQVGKKTDWAFEITYAYRHGLERVPAYQLKGKPKGADGEIYWESLLYNAIPYLNKAAVESSTLDAVITKHGFPTRVYYEEDCDEVGCDNGYLTDGDSRTLCGTCSGTGKKRGFTWGADYTHRPPGRLDSDVQPDFPGMAYITPDMGPMEFLDKRVDGLIEKAGHAVNFDLTRKSSQPVTATEKGIDLQEQYKLLLKFSDVMYDILEYCLDDIFRMRYLRATIEFAVTRRADFSIRSAEQLIAEYEQYQKSGLPMAIGSQIIRSQTKMRFNGNDQNARILEVLEYADGLYGYSHTDAMSIGRAMQPWQVALHFQSASLINQALADDAGFLERELSEIKADLETRAKSLVVAQVGGAEAIINGIP